MKRLLAATALLAVAATGTGPAQAGTVCVNGVCESVPGARGRLTASETGTVKADGGLDGGPGLAPTGNESLTVKPDNVSASPVVHGYQMGRYGYAFGAGVMWIYLGHMGCRQIDDDETFVPCHPPDEDP